MTNGFVYERNLNNIKFGAGNFLSQQKKAFTFYSNIRIRMSFNYSELK